MRPTQPMSLVKKLISAMRGVMSRNVPRSMLRTSSCAISNAKCLFSPIIEDDKFGTIYLF